MAKVAAIIVAAGKGQRFGGSEKKILAKVDGQPMFLRSVQQFPMAVDAANLHRDLLVRDLGDIGVALDAIALSVRAAQKTIFQDGGGAPRLGCLGRREPLLAMTA